MSKTAKVAALMAITLISGCATNPSALTPVRVSHQSPTKETLTRFMAGCQEHACSLPVQPDTFPQWGNGVDLITAIRAASGKGKPVAMKPGNITTFPDDNTPATVSTTNMVSNGGILAMGAGDGDLGLALMTLGTASSASQYKPAKAGYRVSPAIPYLSFYRFYPNSWGGSTPMQKLEPVIQQGVTLLMSAHDGQPMVQGSLDFTGTFIWGNHSQFSGQKNFTLVTSSHIQRNLLHLTWAADGNASHCSVSFYPFPGGLKPAHAAFAVAVRTGQPKNFYTPAQVEKILHALPDSGKWYAVFNMPGHYDIPEQFAINDGKMYRVHIGQLAGQ